MTHYFHVNAHLCLRLRDPPTMNPLSLVCQPNPFSQPSNIMLVPTAFVFHLVPVWPFSDLPPPQPIPQIAKIKTQINKKYNL